MTAGRLRAAPACALVLGLCGLVPLGPAFATPQTGQLLPDVSVDGSDGSRRQLPDRRTATVVIYEDSDAGQQNLRAAALIDATTGSSVNQGKLDAVVIADLEKWNFWPARKFAVAEVRRIAEKEGTTLYIDLKAEVRRAWGLTKHKSGILVVGSDGRVRFAGEGPLSDAQLDDLRQTLTALGVTLPQRVSRDAQYHDAPKTPPVPAPEKR